MEKMTVDQLRDLLTYLEENYSLAYDGEAYGLANALRDKINGVFKVLVLKLNEDLVEI
jgi:hypothetical protein